MEKRPIKEIIATNLTELRKSKGLTQIQLADQFGYTDKAVSKWERGDTTPDIETLCQLADFYGVTIDYLTHDGKKKDKKEYVTENKKPPLNKPVIATLFSLIPVLIILIVYAAITLSLEKNNWVLIIWSLASFFISAFVFSCVWFDKKTKTTIGIIMTWLIILSLYLTFGFYLADSVGYRAWPIFFIGIPITIGFILYNLTRKKQPKENVSEE